MDNNNGKEKNEVVYPVIVCENQDVFGLTGTNKGSCCAYAEDSVLGEDNRDQNPNLWILRLNFAAAMLHFILFCTLLSFIISSNIELKRPLSTKIAVWERYPNTSTTPTCKWDVGCANPVAEPPVVGTRADGEFKIYDTSSTYGELSLGPLILSFSALSFTFQFLRPFVGLGRLKYLDEVERRVNFLRWIEYSFSATTMILAVAFVLNVSSFGTNIMLATSTFATQICGLVGEFLLERKNGNYRKNLFVTAWIIHIAGWVLQFGVFITVFVSYFESVANVEKLGAEEPPPFVYAIVLSMAILFGSFGIVQFVDFIHRTCYDVEGQTGCCKKKVCCACGFVLCKNGLIASQAFELTYILLSLTAKALLALIVTVNLFLEPTA